MLRFLAFSFCIVTSLALNVLHIEEYGSNVAECAKLSCEKDKFCVVLKIGERIKADCIDKDKVEIFRRLRFIETSEQTSASDLHNSDSHVCSEHELNALGGRFLQWFSDIHHQVRGVDKSLGGHTLACREDVAWMFLQWDGDENGFLTKKEVLPILKGDEKCVEQFLDRCDDIIVDNRLSVDEWCDCFSFSDNPRHEPPCHKAKHSADPHLLGVFLPRCDLEGYYRPEQCHSGSCWCVDKYGREFDKSRVEKELPDCGQYAELTKEDEQDLLARM